MSDPHSERALRLFGKVDRDTVDRAKTINFAEAYGAGGVKTARIAGHYPLKG